MKKLLLEDFIKRSKKIHEDKYDYSKVEYVNANVKVCIVCPIHGEFWQKPSDHMRGIGCKLCGIKKCHEKQKFTTETFIKKAKEIHGNKYDYSKVNYIDSKHDVTIICPIHGEFEVNANSHLLGHKCWKCGVIESRDKNKILIKEFIEKSNLKHGNKYDYSKVEYVDYHTEVIITCPIHGDFKVKPIKHVQGCGCPQCSESILERTIRSALEKNKIKYYQEYKFDWLKYKKKLVLDFYLPNYNIAIECQGEQHFGISNWGNIRITEDIFIRDQRKRELCRDNGVQLIYYLDKKYNRHVEDLGIPYFNDCESLLSFINDNFS